VLEFVVFSDLHAHNYSACSTLINGMNSRLLVCTNVLKQVRDYVKENSIPLTVFLGDLFQSLTRLDVEVLNTMYSALSDWPGKLIALVGNHDFSSEPRGIHALEIFKNLLDVIDLPTTLRWEGARFFLAPYRREGWKKELLKARADYYFFHQGIEGVAVQPGVYLQERMILEDLPSAGLIFSGHYHNFQRPLPNTWFVGSPLHRDWGDVDSAKVFLHVRDGKVRRVFTRAPRFVRLSVSSVEDLSRNSKALSGNYVRLEISGLADEEQILKQAYDLGALWAGIETVKRAAADDESRYEAVSVQRLLKSRVQRAPVSLHKKSLFDLGWELIERNKQ